jgi:hypothetical protein
MIWYTVAPDGENITTEDNHKDWFVDDPDTFTNRRKAVAEARRRLKARIAELKEILKETK